MFVTSSWILDILIFCITALFVSYIYLTRNFDYWKKKGIFYKKPIPFFGNFYDAASFKTTIQEQVKQFWDETDDPYFGIFVFDEPVLVLKSPKLIKDVLMKDFTVFCDRRVATPKHPNMAHSVFFQKYLPWKKIRSKLSPLFTSVMLKNMHTHIEQINELTTDYLTKNAGLIDVRTIAGHFATEMIVRCFYGVDPHCFDQKPSHFRKYVHKLFDFNFRNAVIQNLYFIRPSWVSFLKLDFIESDAINFFGGAFEDAMTGRGEFDGKPQNFPDLANKAIKEKQEGKKDVLELDMSVSNAVFFLIAGQETSSTIIGFTLYELAMDENVQNKLREQIKENVEKYGGLTFEGIQDNKYLGMCINETMRKYPALPFLDRTPMTDYRFEGTDFVVEKGTTILIPFYALHRDEKYYPNSEKYDPERFADNSNLNSDGLNFIPFGEGPRACLGKRLGLMGLSMSISNIILKFKVEKCHETPERIEFEPKNFALTSKVGLPLKITPIVQNSST